MPAPLSARKRREIQRRAARGSTSKDIATELGLSQHTVSKYRHGPDLPPPKRKLVDLPPKNDTLLSEVAYTFGPLREPFGLFEVKARFPDRHAVLIARYVRRLLDDGILERLDTGVYVGRARAPA